MAGKGVGEKRSGDKEETSGYIFNGPVKKLLFQNSDPTSQKKHCNSTTNHNL
jgi:hypothetical protein